MSHGTHCSSKIRPTQERVRQALNYNPETGVFRWIEKRRGRMYLSEAGHVDKSTGYRDISLDDRSYCAAKLAWLYMFGEYPECVIDHINRIKDDDRLCNLREATKQPLPRKGPVSRVGLRSSRGTVARGEGFMKWKN